MTLESAAADAADVAGLVDDHAALDDDVWRTVDLYLNDTECAGNFSSVARRLGVAVSTVTRRYDKWLTIQRDIAATKAQAKQHDLDMGEGIDLPMTLLLLISKPATSAALPLRLRHVDRRVLRHLLRPGAMLQTFRFASSRWPRVTDGLPGEVRLDREARALPGSPNQIRPGELVAKMNS